MSAVYLKADTLTRLPQNGAASWSQLIELESYATAWIFIEWTADASTSGTLTWRFSVDPTTGVALPIAFNTTAAATTYAPVVSPASPAITNNVQTIPATAGSYFAQLKDPPPYLQLNYTRTAGAPLFLISWGGRSA